MVTCAHALNRPVAMRTTTLRAAITEKRGNMAERHAVRWSGVKLRKTNGIPRAKWKRVPTQNAETTK